MALALGDPAVFQSHFGHYAAEEFVGVEVVAMLDVTLAEQLDHVAVVGVASVAAAAGVGLVPGFDEVSDIAVARLDLLGHAPFSRGAHGIADCAAVEAALESFSTRDQLFRSFAFPFHAYLVDSHTIPINVGATYKVARKVPAVLKAGDMICRVDTNRLSPLQSCDE